MLDTGRERGLLAAENGLAEYLEMASVVYDRAKSNHTLSIQRCMAMDWLLDKAAEHAQIGAPAASILLNMHARLLFCAAVQTAMTGHLAPIFPVLRVSLESACYANEMLRRSELQDIWLKRHQDEESRKRCRREFGAGLIASVSKRLGEVLVDGDKLIIEHYEKLIDYGGHPNIASVITGAETEETDEHYLFHLPGVSTDKIEGALCLCFETGLYTALVISHHKPIPKEIKEALNEFDHVLAAWQNHLSTAIDPPAKVGGSTPPA